MGKESDRLVAAGGETIENRFMTVNRDRLRRVHETLTPRQQDFIEVVPLLFHVNHPKLPGYVSPNTPAGIMEYTPTQTTMRAAQRICRGFEHERRSLAKFMLHGLYLMGSPGSIAYSRDSDLDLWLCHDPELDEAGVAELAKKARGVEKFAENFDLEVHFFIVNPERFRCGETLSLSDESSGSSQHYLLLDEFYRSSLLLAGLKPLWWRVPAEREHDYAAYVESAKESRRIDPRDYIDFGGLPEIPVEEFFGAAVWQLYKSIESPFKSVLKLLLIEAYAAAHPQTKLLSAIYKEHIEESDPELLKVDPYILMYEMVESYLREREDDVRLEVIRRSFYLKTQVRLSESSFDDDWRAETLREITSGWGWSDETIERLDKSSEWRVDIAMDARRDLINTLKDSYGALSKFARKHAAELKITEADLHVLGRKLYAAFEKKPAKIEIVTRGICVDPSEANLSIHEAQVDDERTVWMLYSGVVKPAERAEAKPLRRAASVGEILVWCLMNGMVGKNTLWHLFAEGSSLTTEEIRRFTSAVEERFHPDLGTTSEAADLSARPYLTRSMLVANLGINPFAGSNLDGVLTSDHTDAFQFGGRRLNLVQGIDLVLANSWDETYYFHYTGPDALLHALAECIRWLPESAGGVAVPKIAVKCFAADHVTRIESRIERTANEALAFLLSNAKDQTPTYVIEIEDQLHRLRLAQGKPQVDSPGGHSELVAALGDPAVDRCQRVHFDAACRRAGLLPKVYALNKPGRVQIFAQRRSGRADVYLLDERGVLLVQNQECFQVSALLQHYRRFLEAALPRCTASPDGVESPVEIGIDTVEIATSSKGVAFKVHEDDLSSTSAYLPLQVLADADSKGHQQFTIHCNHEEFSTWEHGGSLFVAVARYVLSKRAAGETYPVYITDLDLSARFRAQIGMEALRPYDLLKYKKRIEQQLTRALKAEADAGAASVARKPVALAS